ncbi:MAG TPA: helix-turn-helix domain-containing protein [Solirubrobacterales bacterium]|jgi:transcriptional regulator GlxA family with amidase domain|nr:helix-turn-helix domain-containing protein [Solirubrobacterales bacterium]
MTRTGAPTPRSKPRAVRTGAPKIRQGAHRVVALCLPGTVAFDLTAPAQAFRLAYGPDFTPHYGFSTCSVDGAPVATTTGFEIGVEAGLGALRRADTVVVPGYYAIHEPPPAVATAALRAAARRGARLMSVCTGAFALAAAGVLDGRRATTHWAWAADLAARYPAVEVEPEVLFVDEGEVLTSAGLSAGIDLSLHLVRRDHGAACADRVARQMVAPPHRDGGQAQFFRAPEDDAPAPAADGSLEGTREWARRRLAEPLTVEAMARHAGVSPRTFARRFREETGTTPLQWLLARRVLEARRLLEESDLPVEDVALRAGFGNAASLRDHFRRATATTPTAYRRTFQAAP